jgi:hypothetical protein
VNDPTPQSWAGLVAACPSWTDVVATCQSWDGAQVAEPDEESGS